MKSKLLTRAAGKLPKVTFQGIPIVIENPTGSARCGKDKGGKPWSMEMFANYGYIPETKTKADGEDLDVYLGTNPDAPNAYFVEQLTEDGDLDEYKVLLGYDSAEQARNMYLIHYPADWEKTRIGEVHEVPVSRLREATGYAGNS